MIASKVYTYVAIASIFLTAACQREAVQPAAAVQTITPETNDQLRAAFKATSSKLLAQMARCDGPGSNWSPSSIQDAYDTAVSSSDSCRDGALAIMDIKYVDDQAPAVAAELNDAKHDCGLSLFSRHKAFEKISKGYDQGSGPKMIAEIRTDFADGDQLSQKCFESLTRIAQNAGWVVASETAADSSNTTKPASVPADATLSDGPVVALNAPSTSKLVGQSQFNEIDPRPQGATNSDVRNDVEGFTPTASDERSTTVSFQEGRNDRERWETWLAGLSGEYLAGASYWASHRSLRVPGACAGPQSPSTGTDWTAGCVAADEQLARSDALRLSAPDYRRGWNGSFR